MLLPFQLKKKSFWFHKITVVDNIVNYMWLIPIQSEHTKGIRIRNLTTIVKFSRMNAKLLMENFLEKSSARFRLFYKQWNWTFNIVACTCAEPWNLSLTCILIHRITYTCTNKGKVWKDSKQAICSSRNIFAEILRRYVYSRANVKKEKAETVTASSWTLQVPYDIRQYSTTLISNFRNPTKIWKSDIRRLLGSRQWEDVNYKIVKIWRRQHLPQELVSTVLTAS